MNSSNMLSANKVKLHGMTSSQWTTKDKITQYKGLINLYTRDKKIMEMDVAIAKKRQVKELKNLQTDIDINRKKLDNACGGDKQKLRNALAEHRVLQMAYSRSAPTQVIDMIHQVNFTKRKKRDMLRYKMKLKSDKLIDLKLKCAIYEDRLKYEGAQTMLPCEKQAHLITGKVQDAILKKEAAIYIRNSYKEIIAIMKKDAIYFDAILVSLKNDGLAQGKCMINATKLGQMGTEYLDDRRQEYQFLEKIVKTDLVSRKKDLAFVQHSVETFSSNLKNLIRRDSDINIGKITIEESKSFHMLQKEISTIESTLKVLKDAFFTQSFDQIYPCIKEQMHQKERLAQFVQKCEANRDDLLRKSEKAAVMCSILENTMVDTTTAYNAQKSVFRADIKYEIEKTKECEVLINTRYSLLARVRIALRHFQYLARLLAIGMRASGSTLAKSGASMGTRSSALLEPEEDECDGTKIIPELTSKFAQLAASASSAKELVSGTNMELGYRTFEILMRDRSKPIEVDTKASEESFMESAVSDAQVLSRDDIKKISAEIVVEGLAALEYKPPPPPAKKKYKFKK